MATCVVCGYHGHGARVRDHLARTGEAVTFSIGEGMKPGWCAGVMLLSVRAWLRKKEAEGGGR